MNLKPLMLAPLIHRIKRISAPFAKGLLVLFFAFLSATTRAADPLGARLHKDGTTTFRVWAPFVDNVAVRINDGTAVPLAQEPGHIDSADTTWTGMVAGTKAGDQYRYVVGIGAAELHYNGPHFLREVGMTNHGDSQIGI